MVSDLKKVLADRRIIFDEKKDADLHTPIHPPLACTGAVMESL